MPLKRLSGTHHEMQVCAVLDLLAVEICGLVTSRKLPGSKTYFQGYIGTQNDKALSAVELFYVFLEDMPNRLETVDNIKNYLRETLLPQQPGPRFSIGVVGDSKTVNSNDFAKFGK